MQTFIQLTNNRSCLLRGELTMDAIVFIEVSV